MLTKQLENDVGPTHSVLVPDHNGTVQQQGNTNNAPQLIICNMGTWYSFRNLEKRLNKNVNHDTFIMAINQSINQSVHQQGTG